MPRVRLCQVEPPRRSRSGRRCRIEPRCSRSSSAGTTAEPGRGQHPLALGLRPFGELVGGVALGEGRVDAVAEAMNAIHVGVWFTLGPVIAKDTFGPGPWGGCPSAEALGLLLMTLVLLRVTLRYPLRAGMLGMLTMTAPFLVLGVDPSVLPLMALSFAGGAGLEVFGIGWSDRLAGAHPRGGVVAGCSPTTLLGSFLAIPVGQLLAGPLASWFGAQEVAIGGAILYALLVSATLLSPSVRNLERVPQDQQPAGAGASRSGRPARTCAGSRCGHSGRPGARVRRPPCRGHDRRGGDRRTGSPGRCRDRGRR